jgi:hypothetical protein
VSYVSQLCIISHGSFKTLFVAAVNESHYLYCLALASGRDSVNVMSVRGPHGSSTTTMSRSSQCGRAHSRRNRFFVIIVGGELKAVLVYLSFLSGPLLFYCSRHSFLWLFRVSVQVAVREYTHHVLTIPVPCQSNRVLRSSPRT